MAGTLTTSTDVANLTLSLLGVGPIANLDATPDTSDKVLTSLQQWYPHAVEQVIRDLDYEFSAQFVFPTLILTYPMPDYKYAYYYDPSWLKLFRVISGAYPDSKETTVPHRKIISQGSTAVNITAVTQANPCVLTTSAALINGQIVTIAGVGGMTQLDGTYAVQNVDGLTCQLLQLGTGLTDGTLLDSTAFTTWTTGGTVTPIDHYRVLCNVRTQQYHDGSQAPQFEVGILPGIPMWPSEFGTCVATKLALLAGTGIIGIDRKDKIDSIKVDYAQAKNNASANMANESFKGIRKLSASTLSRLRRRPFNRGQSWPY